MLKRNLVSLVAIAACVLGVIGPARGQRGPGGPTTVPANYKGPTTTNSYTPLVIVNADGTQTHRPPVHVDRISDALRKDFAIDPFYTKTITIDGIPVIGSDKVSDYAFLEAAYVFDHMLIDSPQAVRDALIKEKTHVGIISVLEYTMDIPENQIPENLKPQEAAFQDQRSRGLGDIHFATCAEENLLNLRRDPYANEDITIHEFSHTVAFTMGEVNPPWMDHLKAIYKQAMDEGLFAHSYSATDEQEYWAEGAQAWFDCASPRKDATVHSGIWHRDQLKAYDPRLAKLLQDIYGDGSWRYVKTTNTPVKVGDVTFTRTPEELAHLAGLDRTTMPAYNLANSPRIQAWQRISATQPATRPMR